MSKFFDDTMQGLLEAVAIDKGEIPLVEKEDMPAPTLIASEREKEPIQEVTKLRKEKNISQNKLAALTGNKQYLVWKRMSIFKAVLQYGKCIRI